MPKETLGEFEHHVLLAARRLGEEAYTAAIVRELEEVTGREVAPAAVYIALRRLEAAGLADSTLRAPEAGGRERRYFRPTPAGLHRMREARAWLESLWDGAALGESVP